MLPLGFPCREKRHILLKTLGANRAEKRFCPEHEDKRPADSGIIVPIGIRYQFPGADALFDAVVIRIDADPSSFSYETADFNPGKIPDGQQGGEAHWDRPCRLFSGAQPF